MLKLGIIGYPLEHTLSPVMHSASLQYLNIKGEYKAYEVREGELEKKIKELKELGLKGFNVTIPHKTSIIKFLDNLTERAKLVGAVNTVTINSNGKMIGENTDVIGFWEAIPENVRRKLNRKEISVLGCGGAAHAIGVALMSNEISTIKIYGRNVSKLKKFKQFLDSTKEKIKSKTCIETNLLSNVVLSKTQMLVNTTPVGMFPDIDEMPIPNEKLKSLPKDAFVYDIIYNPQETKLLKNAKSLGLQTLNGVEMLVRQGAASLGMWLEQDVAPLGVMRLAVKQCLGNNIPATA